MYIENEFYPSVYPSVDLSMQFYPSVLVSLTSVLQQVLEGKKTTIKNMETNRDIQ